MTYSLAFELPGLPPMNTADGMHWRKRHKLKKYWETAVHYAVIGKRPVQPLERARVRVTRCSSSEPDFENMTQGGKFILDGLVKAGVLIDDKPSVIGQPVYEWRLAKPKHGCVRVSVESVEGGE